MAQIDKYMDKLRTRASLLFVQTKIIYYFNKSFVLSYYWIALEEDFFLDSSKVICSIYVKRNCSWDDGIYSQFHKTLPWSSLQIHWISVRFYEMGDIKNPWTVSLIYIFVELFLLNVIAPPPRPKDYRMSSPCCTFK